MTDAAAALQVLISKEPTVAGRVAAHVADLEDELALLKQLDHPNIVRYLVRCSPCFLFFLNAWGMASPGYHAFSKPHMVTLCCIR